MRTIRQVVPYDTDITIHVSLADAGTGNYRTSPTLAAGDVKKSLDGAAEGNIGTLPAVDGTNTRQVNVVIDNAELQGKRLRLLFADQTAPKEWDDLEIVLETYGHASAMFPNYDLSSATIADAVWDEARSGHVAAGSFGEGVASVVGSVGSVSGIVGGIGVNGILSTSFGTGAITAGAIAADAIGASELAADAVAEIADAIWDEARAGHVGAGTFGEGVASVQGSVTGSVVGAVGSIGVGGIAAASFDAGAINAAAIAADAIGASELAADAVAEIQSGLATSANQTTILDKLGAFTGSGVNTVLGFFKALLSKTASTPSDVGGTFDPATDSVEAIRDRGDAAWLTATGFSTLTQADVRAAVGLASANLDTQLGAIDDYLDTEVAAIKAKTDNLPSDPADQSAVEAAITAAQVAIIAEVDANETKIDIIDGVVDAIKLKTDNLPAAPAAVGDIPTTGEIADTVWGAQVIDNQTFGSFGAKVNEIHDDIQGLNDLSAAEAADAVWDEALSGHATAGSTGEALSNASAGGTPPTVGAIADAVWDEALGGHVGAGSTGKALSDIKAITDTLTSPSITVTSPVAAGGDVSMIAGYDYTDESGQTLTWTLEGAPDLTGATVDVVQIEPDADGNEVSYDWEVDVEDAGEATQTVRAQVTGAQTAALGEPGRVARHRFRIKATLANTAQVALVDATMTIT